MQSFIYLLARDAAERDALKTLECRIEHESDLDALRDKAIQTAHELALDIPWLTAFLDDLTARVTSNDTPKGYTPYNAYVTYIHRLVHGLTAKSKHIFNDDALLADPRLSAPHLAWIAPFHAQALQHGANGTSTARGAARWLHQTHGLSLQGKPVPHTNYQAARALYLEEWLCMGFTEFLNWYVANLEQHGEFKADETLV